MSRGTNVGGTLVRGDTCPGGQMSGGQLSGGQMSHHLHTLPPSYLVGFCQVVIGANMGRKKLAVIPQFFLLIFLEILIKMKYVKINF